MNQYPCTTCGGNAFVGYVPDKQGQCFGVKLKKGERLCVRCFKARGGINFFEPAKRRPAERAGGPLALKHVGTQGQWTLHRYEYGMSVQELADWSDVHISAIYRRLEHVAKVLYRVSVGGAR